MKARKYPSREELSAVFEYSPDFPSGLLWKVDRNHGLRGKVAGGKHLDGYWIVELSNIPYMTSRIVYILHNGELADDLTINHEDCNRSNNSIENLKPMTQLDNNRKKGRHVVDGRTPNVVWDTDNEKWAVYTSCRDKSKRFFIGYYDDENMAIERSTIANELRPLYTDGARLREAVNGKKRIGVSKLKGKEKYRASIHLNHHHIHLGTADSSDGAYKIYQKADELRELYQNDSQFKFLVKSELLKEPLNA